jgi:hypothetical protein
VGFHKPGALRWVPKKEEVPWLFKVDKVDMTGDHERCTKRFAQNARKNAKSLLNPVGIVRFTAKSATQREKIAVVKREANDRRHHRCRPKIDK